MKTEQMTADEFADLLLRLDLSRGTNRKSTIVSHNLQSVFLLKSPFFRELEDIAYIDGRFTVEQRKTNLRFAYIGVSDTTTIHSIVEIKDKKKLRGRIPNKAWSNEVVYEWLIAAFGRLTGKKHTNMVSYIGVKSDSINLYGNHINYSFYCTDKQTSEANDMLLDVASKALSASNSLSIQHELMWHVKIWIDDYGVVTTINPATARFFFKYRDVCFGKTRRSSIRNFVEEHERWIKSQQDYTTVKEHLRGKVNFQWMGLNVQICPAEADLRRLNYTDNKKASLECRA